jgi:hypothetical protein
MAVLLVSETRAQTPTGHTDVVSREEYDAAFRAMLANPSNLDLTFRYAELAIAVGDLEGAIGAYESLLLLNQDLPRVRLALGQLYLRLGSAAAARGYLEAARDSPTAAPETQQEATKILAALGEVSGQRFAGYLQLGGNWQSNANNGAAAAQVRSFGVSVPLPRNAQKTPDIGAVLSGDVGHYANLNGEGDAVLESHARFYLTRQRTATNVNLGVLQVDSGPRFALGSASEGGYLRPYATAGLIGLADRLFQWNAGAGVGLTAPLGERWTVDANLSDRGQFYTNSFAQPTASGANGATFDASAVISFSPTLSDTLRAGPSAEILDASNAGQRYQQYGLQAGWLHAFVDPTGWSARSWTFDLEGNRLWRDYAGPDPTVDPVIARADREWNLEASLTIPISESWMLIGDVSQQWVTSNLSNYRFDDTTISLSLGLRF